MFYAVGKGSLLHSFLTSALSDKNEPWALNTSLPRDQEYTEPFLGLPPYVELSFPVSSSVCAPLFCLSVCFSGPQECPQEHPLNSGALKLIEAQTIPAVYFANHLSYARMCVFIQ